MVKNIDWCRVPLFVITHWDPLQTYGLQVEEVDTFVSSGYCVKFVSLASPVSLCISVEMCSSSNACASESNSSIKFMMSRSIRLLLVTTLLNALRPKQHTPNSIPSYCDSSICTAWPVTRYYCSHKELTCVELKIRHKHEPTLQKSDEQILTSELRTFPPGPILH